MYLTKNAAFQKNWRRRRKPPDKVFSEDFLRHLPNIFYVFTAPTAYNRTGTR